MKALVLLLLAALLPAAELEIRVVYDNTSARPGVQEDWGFAAVVTFQGRRVLFDSGTKPELFLENLGKLAVSPASIETAVISHEHGDHRNGIYRLWPQNPAIPVRFLDAFPPKAFEEAAAIGMRPLRVTGPEEIVPGVWTTGFVPGRPPEQSLLIETSKGLVMLTGCSHPGIVTLVETALRQRGKDSVYLLLGGFHLFQTPEADITAIAARLKELGVARIRPAHCSGDGAKSIFRRVFGEGFGEAGAGLVLSPLE